MTISKILTHPLTWIVGLILAALSSWLSGILEEFLPNPREIEQIVECAFEDSLPPSQNQFRFVLSRLESDDNPERRQDIFNRAFMDIQGIELVASKCIVEVSAIGPIAIREQQKRAQRILKRLSADVLIFGIFHNGTDKRHLGLAFAPRQEDAGGIRESSLGTELYKLNAPRLGEDFKEDIREWIIATALATAASAADHYARGQLLTNALADEANKIKELLQGPTITEPERLADLNLAHGTVLQTLGELKKDGSLLAQAAYAFRKALKVITREGRSLSWARTQNRLGGTLRILGGMENNQELLNQAVAARNAALTVFTREGTPLDWAHAQNNLGNTLQGLGHLEDNAERLKQAIGAHEAALMVFTYDRWPLDWANTKNSLGVALELLGMEENDATRLEQAANTYSEALTVFTHENMPRNWAKTQRNLARILQNLAERTRDVARLEQAANAHKQALTVFTYKNMPLNWARTQNDLGNALQLLGQFQDNSERLKEAVNAYNEALTVFTLEDMPFARARTQDNLRNALQVLGQLQDNSKGLKEGKGEGGISQFRF